VQDTTLHLGGLAEHLLDACRQGLGAIDDAQHAGFGGEPPGDEVGQQGGDHRLVLGVAEPEPDGHLGAVRGDDQGDHDTRAGYVEPVDHERDHVEVGQVPGHQLAHGLDRRRYEAPGDGRLGRGPRACLEFFSDGFGHVNVAPSRHPGQHAFEYEGVEQVGRAEGLPGIELDLGARGAPAPRALGCHRAVAEHHRTLGGAVPVATAI